MSQHGETHWIPVARIQDLPQREGRVVLYEDREIAIFNLGTRVLAVENRCPHKAGPLADGIVSGTTIMCPLHAWKFNLESGEGVNALSAANCIETFRTRMQGDIVLVEVATKPLASHMPEPWNEDSVSNRAEDTK